MIKLLSTTTGELILSLFLALLFGGIAGLFFPSSAAILVGTLTFLLAQWSLQTLPMGLVSLLPLLLFPGFGLLTLEQTAPLYAHPVIFLFIGGFLLALATEKTGLHQRMAGQLLQWFPSSPRGVLYACAVSSAIFSSFLSNTTTALLLIPLAALMSNQGQMRTRLVLAIAYGASIGGIITPIGTPPNLILLGFLETTSLGSIGFAEWFLMTLPLAFLMLVLMVELLLIGQNQAITAHTLDELAQSDPQQRHQQRRLIVILIGDIAILLGNPLFKAMGLGVINEKSLFLAAGLAMFLPGIAILDWKRDFHHLPFEILFLFGAGFSIAKAFAETGLARQLVENLGFLQQWPLFWLLLGITAAVVFLTEVTSNTALAALALPILLGFAEQSGSPPLLLLMTTAIAASYAFMLPIATPPNAIALSSGLVTPGQMARHGFWLNWIGILLTSAVAWFYWQWWM